MIDGWSYLMGTFCGVSGELVILKGGPGAREGK